jgi:hypothetical protein
MRRKTKIVTISVTLTIVVLLIPIIGPFTFYDKVVPILGPILPKPDGVPDTADASFNWKGAGLFWFWQKRYESGCTSWSVADNGFYNFVRLLPGSRNCSDDERGVDHYSFSEEINFQGAHDLSGGEPCPFAVTDAYIESVRKLVAEAQTNNTSKIEAAALQRVVQRVKKVDGAALVTRDRNGCSDLKFSDFDKR